MHELGEERRGHRGVVGHDEKTALNFIHDLESSLTTKSELTSDLFSAYVDAAPSAWADEVDNALLVSVYEAETPDTGSYSSPMVSAEVSTTTSGALDAKRMCTSHIERQNLAIRMACRRFTRLIGAFRKKLENLKATLTLHPAFCNLVRIHRSRRMTPAMACDVADRLWMLSDLPEVIP